MGNTNIMQEAVITYIIAGFIQLGVLVLPTSTVCVIAPVEFDLAKITANFDCSVIAGEMAFRVVGTVYNLEIVPDKKVQPDLAFY